MEGENTMIYVVQHYAYIHKHLECKSTIKNILFQSLIYVFLLILQYTKIEI